MASEVWKPGMVGNGPVACPVCDSMGTANGMPAHIIEEHPDHRWTADGLVPAEGR